MKGGGREKEDERRRVRGGGWEEEDELREYI